jgi:2-dehydro-3-deoxyphosphooctonate aldolase (KDO 8-P synthase)
MPSVDVGDIRVGSGEELCYIGGPCVLESSGIALKIARALKTVAAEKGLSFVFKASYDKANRMRIDSGRGPGLQEGLEILSAVRSEVGVPVVTDVHSPAEAERAAEAVDMLQIPAMLCRQTDLIVAAARTGKPLNIKKGQFMSPWDMEHVATKAASTGNRKILLTERGSSFGYGMLVNDMRAIAVMQGFGYPVVFDAGHSVQMPGSKDGRSGGMREMIPVLARAGVAAGADALFVECHENPDSSPSDGPNMLPLEQVGRLLSEVKAIYDGLRRARREA